jgi:crossover junction endodeoxyribonuclease RuvC
VRRLIQLTSLECADAYSAHDGLVSMNHDDMCSRAEFRDPQSFNSYGTSRWRKPNNHVHQDAEMCGGRQWKPASSLFSQFPPDHTRMGIERLFRSSRVDWWQHPMPDDPASFSLLRLLANPTIAVFSFCEISPVGSIAAMGISLQEFEQMKVRTGKPRRTAATGVTAASRRHESNEGVIIGIDPSLRGTGFGVIRMAKGQPQLLACGTIACPAAWEKSRCLARILQTLREVHKTHQPDTCVVEGLFYAQNLKTAIIMGEARGAALAAVAEAGADIYEIAPRKVKKAIVGYGAAQKLAVAKMVQRILNLAEPPEPDAADALALALAHAQSHSRFSLAAPKKI